MHECGSETVLQQIWLQHDHQNRQFLNTVFTYGQQTVSMVTSHVRFSRNRFTVSTVEVAVVCRGTHHEPFWIEQPPCWSSFYGIGIIL